jgi:hypothetical protein
MARAACIIASSCSMVFRTWASSRVVQVGKHAPCIAPQLEQYVIDKSEYSMTGQDREYDKGEKNSAGKNYV